MTPISAEISSESVLSSVDVTEVNSYLKNATKVLVEAQTLCSDTNKRITIIKDNVSILQKNISKLRFLYNCLEKQGNFLLNGILKKNIGENLITKEWSNFILVDLVNQMRQWQKRIDDQVAKLDNIENTLNSNQTRNFLGDYISRDNVDILNEKLNEIPIIQKHIATIKLQYNDMLRKVNEKLIKKNMKEVKIELEVKFDQSSNQDMILLNETYSEQIVQLEEDLVSFLDSLTDHFDKCQLLKSYLDGKGSSASLNYNEFNDLFEVVEKDDKELDSILVSLCDIIDDVDKILPKYNELIDKKVKDKDELNSKMTKIINYFDKNAEYLVIFKDIAKLISLYKNSCLKDIQMVKELKDFYTNFEKSYDNLINEVQRRRNYSNKVQDIIDDCKRKLETLNTDDLKERQQFLEKNGNFLPENIWPNEIDDLAPLYTLQYSIKKL